MTRYPPAHRDAVRARLVTAASEQWRSQGLGTGVRAIMQDAGLTHGGFYSYFPSRDALLAEAMVAALGATRERLAAAADAVPPDQGLAAIIDAYLSERHIPGVARGCAAAALAPEIAREDPATRAAFTTAVAAIVTLIAEALPPGDTERQARARSLFALMMGTLQLARATPDAEAALRLLADGRSAARALAGIR